MVSSLGRIRSYKMNKSDGILLRIGADYAGYRRVHLDGVHYYVHKAVALAWIGPCPDGMELHHINHDRGDNRPENLEYETRQGNIAKRRKPEPKSHCKLGHHLAGENLYVVPSTGQRVCRICRRRQMNRRDKTGCPTCGQQIPTVTGVTDR
jgi:hypothetical protein